MPSIAKNTAATHLSASYEGMISVAAFVIPFSLNSYSHVQIVVQSISIPQWSTQFCNLTIGLLLSQLKALLGYRI